MIPSLVLVQVGLLAAAPITISSVEAVREGGRLAITVKGDAMIDPEAASAKIADGRLFLFVRDARVHEANRAWGQGASEIRAHRHRHEVELVVPLGDAPCQGAVELGTSPGGLRAYVSCDEKAARGVASGPKAKAAPAEAKAAAPPPEERPAPKQAPRPAPSAIVDTALEKAVAMKAALVLQPPKAGDKGAETPSPAKAPAKAPGSAAAALVTTTVASDLPPGGGAKGGDGARDVAAGKSSGGGGGSGGMLAAGVLLGGLAFAAFHFTRRRAKSSRYIQIVESASLGPKRSIIVARVGDATMVLGSSEAGITLLKALPEPNAERTVAVAAPAAPAAAVAPSPVKSDGEARRSTGEVAPIAVASASTPAAASDDIPVDDLGLDDPTPARQGDGLIARFFRRGDDGEAKTSAPESFEDLLEDSLEDQELRRKLSLGMAGRVR